MAAAPAPFAVSVYKKSRAFNIPKRICNQLGVRSGDSIHLVLKTPSGDVLFNNRADLKSGSEIYGKDISSALTPGSTIWVHASEPRCLEAEAEAASFDAQEREAGFQPNAEIRGVVENYAMGRAKEDLSGLGFSSFKDTSKSECYDYACKRDGGLYFVEVKGTQGEGTSVILTKNEVAHAQKYPQRSIAVIVHHVKIDFDGGVLHASGGVSCVCLPWIVEAAALEPIQYKWTVSRNEGKQVRSKSADKAGLSS